MKKKLRRLLTVLIEKPTLIGAIVRTVIKTYDPFLISEILGERFVFIRLKQLGLLENCQNKRILEIGPKHGKDSLLLAGLDPMELVLLDLPEKDAMIQKWLPTVSSKVKTTYLQGNLLYLKPETYRQLGKFDLIWCTGVLYHNAEQLRLIKRLFDLCNLDGSVVLESEITNRKKLQKLNAVEIHWPDPFKDVPTITHLPSPIAMKSWMEMAGFQNVDIRKVLSRYLGRTRAVLTGMRTARSKTYLSYNNPAFIVGDST
ncbi:class I SAM-dependent methyltransferase [Candidatus Neomarinimicrobiota bacterium]